MQHRKNNKKTGFTLIELMVSISIFSVVMLIVIGALLMLNDANKKAQAMRAIVDNLNFATEDMTRNIRTGRDFKCGLSVANGRVNTAARDCQRSDVETGISTLGFTGISTDALTQTCYVYSFRQKTDTLPGSISYGSKDIDSGRDCVEYFSSIQLSELVSPEVEVAGLQFYVFNETSSGPDQQPIVILALSGDINVEQYKFKTPFNIQTTVSQRGKAF
ncbi:MAG TPA: type II secretion system protein [Candidatus Paceibacterota bacterium]|nr:type II secretion system protein [Candidatus Paceibacterota bacterium]